MLQNLLIDDPLKADQSVVDLFNGGKMVKLERGLKDDKLQAHSTDFLLFHNECKLKGSKRLMDRTLRPG